MSNTAIQIQLNRAFEKIFTRFDYFHEITGFEATNCIPKIERSQCKIANGSEKKKRQQLQPKINCWNYSKTNHFAIANLYA